MHHIDLFSGIGGFALALKGISKACLYCDIDPYAQSVLLKNMAEGKLPRAPVIPDIRDITKTCVPRSCRPNLICSSFPCVGFSGLGGRLAFEEKQTGLFYEMLRVIDVFKTPMVFLENVPRILNHGMQVVTHEFSKRGYGLRWVVIPASAVGQHHRRERWFCLCVRHGFDLGSLKTFGRRTSFAKRSEPRRMVLRRGVSDTKALGALGNALVPACARLAFELLTSSRLSESRVASEGWPRCGSFVKNATRTYICPRFDTPRLDLVLLSRKLPKTVSPMFRLPVLKRRRLDLWATPRAGNTTRSRILTDRSAKDLYTQLAFEKRTRLRDGYPNVGWVEWLMGFPHGWL